MIHKTDKDFLSFLFCLNVCYRLPFFIWFFCSGNQQKRTVNYTDNENHCSCSSSNKMYTTAANSFLIQVKRKKKERDDSSEIRLGLIETRTRSLRLRQYEHWWRSILMLYGINGWFLRIFLYLFLYSWYPKRPPPFFLCVCVCLSVTNNKRETTTTTIEQLLSNDSLLFLYASIDTNETVATEKDRHWRQNKLTGPVNRKKFRQPLNRIKWGANTLKKKTKEEWVEAIVKYNYTDTKDH